MDVSERWKPRVRWVRLWQPGGPGVAIYDSRGWVPFSIRNGHRRALRIGRWYIAFARRGVL